MNPELIKLALQAAIGLSAFLREAAKDDDALKALVAQARAEGREVDQADVQAQLGRMHAESDSLSALIAAKTAG